MRAEIFEGMENAATHFNRTSRTERRLTRLTSELRTAIHRGENADEVRRQIDITFKRLWRLRMKG